MICREFGPSLTIIGRSNRPKPQTPVLERELHLLGYEESEAALSLAQVLTADSQHLQERTGQDSEKTTCASTGNPHPLSTSMANHNAALLFSQSPQSTPENMSYDESGEMNIDRNSLSHAEALYLLPELSPAPNQDRVSILNTSNTPYFSVASPHELSEQQTTTYQIPFTARQDHLQLHTSLRRAQSTPSIALSKKLSTVFFAPTVVRRSNKVKPPGINNFRFEPSPSPRGQEATPLRIFLPATPPSTPVRPLNLLEISPITATPPLSFGDSLSPVSHQQSTGLTSPVSEEKKPRLFFPIRRFGRAINEDESNPTSPMQIDDKLAELDVIDSVATVERTAAAKVYFETFYNGPMFENLTPRSMRRRKMEVGLFMTRKSPSEQEEVREHFVRAESDHLREMRAFKVRKSNNAQGITRGAYVGGYEMVRLLGRGSFGVVSLVRECPVDESSRQTQSKTAESAVYAMKVIRKSVMLRNCQEGHLRAERDFLVSCAENSKWVVPLVASFQDKDNLYLVMEFEIGGDFLQFLLSTTRNGVIPEHWAQWYVAEMILCVEEAHRMKWIHRDVKPDNFLISASGHLKISDFGLAFDGHWAHTQGYYTQHRYSLLEKLGIHVEGDREDQEKAARSPRKRHILSIKGPKDAVYGHSRMNEPDFRPRKLAASVVGTSQYMAPEVVQGLCYDGRCDWWSIGIILYECLFGTTPFLRKDRYLTKLAICHHASEFDWIYNIQPTSPQVRDLICRLLSEKEIRLCSKKYFQNDFKRDTRGAFVRARDEDKMAVDFEGKCVFPDDAEDIKRHPFFAGIPWDHIHLTRPPFIPKVGRNDETRYFESEARILADFSTFEESDANAMGEQMHQQYPLHNGEKRMAADTATSDDNARGSEREQKRRKKTQKRPRDKLLRDPVVAKTVMAARKKGAFLGYTYRRPKTWSLGSDLRVAYAQMGYGYDGFGSGGWESFYE